MGWVRFDNAIGSHEKALEIQEDLYLPALGLLLLAVGYCDQLRTDGFLPRKALKRIAYGDVEAAAAELVRVGFLDEVDGGYQVHDYLEWQRSAEQIESAIDKARRAGIASAAVRSTTGSTTSSTTGSTDRRQTETIDKNEKNAQGDACVPRPVLSEQVRDLQVLCNHLNLNVCGALIAEFGFETAVEAVRRAKLSHSNGETVHSWPAFVRGIALNVGGEGR